MRKLELGKTIVDCYINNYLYKGLDLDSYTNTTHYQLIYRHIWNYLYNSIQLKNNTEFRNLRDNICVK